MGTSRSLRRVQRLLIASEVALAFSLLTGAALLMQRLLVLTQRIDAGFKAKSVLTARVPRERRHTPGLRRRSRRSNLGSRSTENIKHVPVISSEMTIKANLLLATFDDLKRDSVAAIPEP